jgi:hypothetical protein
MITVNLSGRFKYNVAEAVNEALGQESMQDLADKAEDLIYARTKRGIGSDNEKLAPLSESYIEQRKGLIKFFKSKYDGHTYAIHTDKKHKFDVKLGELATPTKSNATFTGQMLRAMANFAGFGYFDVFIRSSERQKGNITNSEVADYYQRSRPFLNYTDGEQRTILRYFEEKVRAALAKIQAKFEK